MKPESKFAHLRRGTARTGFWNEDISELLTQEEVDALPDGTKVVITWSGGNGPHIYTINHNKHGMVRAYAHGVHHVIDFVGKKRYHTHVSIYKQQKGKPDEQNRNPMD